MISEKIMDLFRFDKNHTYQITNPLSDEWVYMRPSLLPSMLMAIKQNIPFEQQLKLFELSNVYEYQKGTLPHERPMVCIAVTGSHFLMLKGIAETLFSIFGISFPHDNKPGNNYYNQSHSLTLGDYGYVGEINHDLLQNIGINKSVTVLELDIERLVQKSKKTKQYHPIPKYPASYEDIAFVVPDEFPVGPLIQTIKTADPLIADVSLLDTYANTKTLHIVYQSPNKNLEAEDIGKARNKILKLAAEKFGVKLKSL